jgi:hypothetical protein
MLYDLQPLCPVVAGVQDYSQLFTDNKFDMAVDCLPGG